MQAIVFDTLMFVDHRHVPPGGAAWLLGTRINCGRVLAAEMFEAGGSDLAMRAAEEILSGLQEV